MFRKMRRSGQQVTDGECRRILREEKRAAFSVIGDDGYPYTIPVDFFFDETENRIYIHGAKEGHKIDAIRKCDKVCLTVWNQGFKKDGRWEWNATSVVVFGRVSFVDDADSAAAHLRRLAEKYYPSPEEAEKELNSSAVGRVQMLAVGIEHMTGKLVNER